MERIRIMMLKSSKALLLCVVTICALLLVGCKSGKGEEVYFSSTSPSLNSSEQGVIEQSSTTQGSNEQTDIPTQSRDEYTETDDVMLPDNGEGVKPSGSSQTQSSGHSGSVSSGTADTSSDVTGSSSQTVASSDNMQTNEQSSDLEGSSSEEEKTSSETSSKEPSVKDPIVLPDDIW